MTISFLWEIELHIYILYKHVFFSMVHVRPKTSCVMVGQELFSARHLFKCQYPYL